MLTDAPPRNRNRTGFLESDRIKALDLPENESLPAIVKSMETAMRTGKTADVRHACAEFLDAASEFYRVPTCAVSVLAARPLRVREHWATELFGDYNPETMLVRLWMRTAVRKQVTSFGTFLSTLCHEFCHHLDFHRFRFDDSRHTRGFYERTAALYHYHSVDNVVSEMNGVTITDILPARFTHLANEGQSPPGMRYRETCP